MKKSVKPQTLSKTLALVPPAVLLVAQQMDAGPIYIKIGDIKGEATAKGHEEWIEASSFDLDVERPAAIDTKSGNVISTGIATAGPLQITKELDKSSPLLFLACARGENQTQVILESTTDGATSELYYRLTLDSVLVNKISSSATPDAIPEETIEVTFSKLTIEYFQNGKLVEIGTYDFVVQK